MDVSVPTLLENRTRGTKENQDVTKLPPAETLIGTTTLPIPASPELLSGRSSTTDWGVGAVPSPLSVFVTVT